MFVLVVSFWTSTDRGYGSHPSVPWAVAPLMQALRKLRHQSIAAVPLESNGQLSCPVVFIVAAWKKRGLCLSRASIQPRSPDHSVHHRIRGSTSSTATRQVRAYSLPWAAICVKRAHSLAWAAILVEVATCVVHPQLPGARRHERQRRLRGGRNARWRPIRCWHGLVSVLLVLVLLFFGCASKSWELFCCCCCCCK